MSWLEARQEITEGKDYRDTVEVPFGEKTIDLTHRLLTETELLEIESTIDREEMVDHMESEASDAEQRLQQLQQKDDLTTAEEQELQDLARQIQAEQAGIMNSMGMETFKAFMNAGKTALTPSEEDIEEHFDLSAEEQRQRFNFVPNTRDDMREAIELEMEEMVQEQPYPIKLIVGQKAYAESLSLLGDTELSAGNPT